MDMQVRRIMGDPKEKAKFEAVGLLIYFALLIGATALSWGVHPFISGIFFGWLVTAGEKTWLKKKEVDANG